MDDVRIAALDGVLAAFIAGDAAGCAAALMGVALVAAPIAKVWHLLPNVYDSLGLTIATLDSARHLIGNGDAKMRRQVGGVPRQIFAECRRTRQVR